MRLSAGRFFLNAIICVIPVMFSVSTLIAQDAHFHNAPTSSNQLKNPYAGQQAALSAGAKLYATNCGSCHGIQGRGTGNVPPLAHGPTQVATDGEVFWFITTGSVNNGMPSWAALPEQQRWQIVAYLKSLKNSTPAPSSNSASADVKPVKTNAPPPQPPYADFRYEQPGKVRKITVQDFPAPYVTESASNGPQLVARPRGAWPKAPTGFVVQEYATGLDNPRLIRTAPNGDFFLAESSSGKITVFRGITAGGKPEQTETFATGLNQPYGIAFYPPGENPRWVYVGNTDSVVRYPYKNGELKASGPAQHIVDLPHGSGHWTRDIQFSADGKKMFVAVGSASNVDDPDTTPAEKNRADILEFNPDGSDMRVYAYGIRNAGGGLAINPKTGELWCSVNERDGLGDNLVPDYITRVEEGGFYGWPWWYIGNHQDPRHEGKHPELRDKALVPDVLLQPHNASLEMTFYEGTQFPSEYQGDIFASEHGSWNRSVRAGYEVIRVPLHQTSRASGEYEDFVTGFAVDNGHVWGRPVGVTEAQDGSLLVTDDGSNSIWRITYTGSESQQRERNDASHATKRAAQ
ncbi:MAG TPA: PQQ-dependent sugar dehydrogenase [Candidatus Acidoferrales bacterium]|nr:PQQ-dependent sugar dehydrogenase [Candidatus Acidoferrales bacterium]